MGSVIKLVKLTGSGSGTGTDPEGTASGVEVGKVSRRRTLNQDAEGVEGVGLGIIKGVRDAATAKNGFQCFSKFPIISFHSMPLVEVFVTN